MAADAAPHVLVLRHAACEGLGAIGDALRDAGYATREVCAHAGEPIPSDLDGARGLVVMGGPMGVYEVARHPHLADELRLLERALRRDAPVLGVCLGSQLLATALGARVTSSGTREIGWHPVDLLEACARDPLFEGVASPITPLNWHGDVFELPRGAERLARSAMTEHQAFRFGRRAWGLLFHLEADAAQVRAMSDAFPGELRDAGLDPAALARASEEQAARVRETAMLVFGRWARVLA
jgi:GMP synthase (glutamine-hydrolysing)